MCSFHPKGLQGEFIITHKFPEVNHEFKNGRFLLDNDKPGSTIRTLLHGKINPKK